MQEANSPKAGPLASLLSIFDSTPGRKIVMGLTGLGLVGFTIGHLLGNLSLFFGTDAFNAYAHKLEKLGPILYAVEFGLLAVFIFHIVFALTVTAQNKKARGGAYVAKGSAGKPSRKNASSQSMIYTGIILMVFVIAHVWMFKFGPNVAEGYVTNLHGEPVRDLYALVVNSFKNPMITLGYTAVMILLGLHIRHGFWSAFQSLGAYHPRYTPLIYTLGVILAVSLAIGFIAMPAWIYFQVPAIPITAP